MSDLPFTLDQLRILRAIATEGSFKRAADSLYVSQPAVSLQVQNLERQLNVPLFNRGGRRAELTEPGRLLLSYGEKILLLCDDTCRAIEDLQNLQGGTLIVGASQTTGTYLLPRMIGLFHKHHPEVSVQLHVHSTRRTSWSVANGPIDLAIIGGEVPLELQESLEIAPYAEDELALVLPMNHPLAIDEPIPKEELYNLRFITLDSQSTIRKVIDQVLTRCGIETQRLHVEMELNSIEAIKNAVQSGLGAAFVSTSAIEKELQLGGLARVRIEGVVVKRMLCVVSNPSRYRSKAAEAFIREILPLFAANTDTLVTSSLATPSLVTSLSLSPEVALTLSPESISPESISPGSISPGSILEGDQIVDPSLPTPTESTPTESSGLAGDPISSEPQVFPTVSSQVSMFSPPDVSPSSDGSPSSQNDLPNEADMSETSFPRPSFTPNPPLVIGAGTGES